MARLIVWNLITLDGFFEGLRPWEIDWHPWGEELETLSLDQLHSAGGLLFGRKTYEGMAGYWSTATGEIADLMNALPKAVVSRTLSGASWTNTVLLPDAGEAVVQWKKKSQRDLFVFGSAELADSLLSSGLIDEFRLCLVPTILGGGSPHFKLRPQRLNMNLLEARALKLGCVLLKYHPSAGPPA